MDMHGFFLAWIFAIPSNGHINLAWISLFPIMDLLFPVIHIHDFAIPSKET